MPPAPRVRPRHRSSTTPGRVVLAGSLDTVPAQDNLPGRIEDGWVVGLGATDMKGGVAVMIELARARCAVRLPLLRARGAPGRARARCRRSSTRARPRRRPRRDARADGQHDPGRLPREPQRAARLPRHERALGAALARRQRDHARRRGTRAARVGSSRYDVEIDGLVFREVAQRRRRSRAGSPRTSSRRTRTAILNFRYAPDRTPAERRGAPARARGRRGDLELLGNSPPARVAAASPLVQALRDAGDFALEPKQAWTPVAEFSAQGLDAVNLGPGATRYAHTQDERVEIAALAQTYDALRALRSNGAGDPRSRSRRCRRTRSCGSTRRRRTRARAGIELIDFGMGDPIEPTPRVHPAARSRTRCR